jgi:glyoxylase-like metal-dependent hydrolase (beta-lactamase superfamily II)
MRLHFTNTAVVPVAERLVLRGGSWRRKLAVKVRVGILERSDGPVLIDAGYGVEALQGSGRSWPLRAYGWALAPVLLPEGAPDVALARLGYAPSDVTAVIVTHFHADHVATLARFPQARLIAHRATFDLIRRRSGFANLHRGIFPELFPADMAERLVDIAGMPRVEGPLGLGAAHDIFGDGAVLAVDLAGHAEGHFGVCLPGLPRPLLYAVDAQWLLAAIPDRLPGPPASLIAEDGRALVESAGRVARFARAGGEVVLCHDPDDCLYDLQARA